jgi:hypothetical protein
LIATAVQEAAENIEAEARRMLYLARQLQDAAEFLKLDSKN